MSMSSTEPEGAGSLLSRRSRVLAGSYRLFYEHPVQFVRGEGTWLIAPDGTRYLDAYNNVPGVGHCHPHVVEAMARQAARLNTHTRYLTEQIVDYAERLVGYFPESLDRVILTCTGSEANDLAYRIARCATGNVGVVVSENAYHGVTSAVAGVSPSLGTGVDPWVRTVAIPSTADERAGQLLADRVREAAQDLRRNGYPPAALLFDTIFASDGILPGRFLQPAANEMRRAGGLVIADEVQAGFARLGPAMWGFERHDLEPDVVTLGKPMGNGYPLAGLVCGNELADAFGSRTRFFNTFGGNPVACSAGLAVLDVIEQEGLRERAAAVGSKLQIGLQQIADGHPMIGAVRGAGLYIGMDVVAADGSGDPASCRRLVNELRERRVLVGTCGPTGATVKVRPPLVFGPEHSQRVVDCMDDALTSLERNV